MSYNAKTAFKFLIHQIWIQLGQRPQPLANPLFIFIILIIAFKIKKKKQAAELDQEEI